MLDEGLTDAVVVVDTLGELEELAPDENVLDAVDEKETLAVTDADVVLVDVRDAVDVALALAPVDHVDDALEVTLLVEVGLEVQDGDGDGVTVAFATSVGVNAPVARCMLAPTLAPMTTMAATSPRMTATVILAGVQHDSALLTPDTTCAPSAVALPFSMRVARPARVVAAAARAAYSAFGTTTVSGSALLAPGSDGASMASSLSASGRRNAACVPLATGMIES